MKAIGRLRLSKDWVKPGALRRVLLDLWTEQKTGFAKRVMKEIERDRRKVKQGLMGGGGLMSGYQPGQAGMMGALVLRSPPARKSGGQR